MSSEQQTDRLSISDLDIERPIHLAGVAGSAMSGLALLLRERGFRVIGTDPRADEIRSRLEAAGVEVHADQDGSKIPPNAGLLVATAALPMDHPELRTARERGLRIATYAEFLGALMAEAQGVAIAGTHGKTTTTAMIVSVLRSAGVSPGFVIGGHVPEIGANAGSGTSNIFVAEACEYNRSFLHLKPHVAVITNIEEDHLDIYKDIDDICHAFREFSSELPRDGLLIYSAECSNTASVVTELDCPKLSFAVENDATLSAQNLRDENNATVFDLVEEGDRLTTVRISLPGRHNVANALATFAACRELGVHDDQIVAGLASFRGVGRRFEIRGEAGGIVIVDDYAHHPTEIRALLEAASRRFPGRRLVVAFQPHQCSRTRLLLDEFAGAFGRADLVFIPDIYSVRDTAEERARISAADLVRELNNQGTRAEYAGDLGTLVDHLLRVLVPGDVALTVGAGNVDSVVEDLLARLSSRGKR